MPRKKASFRPHARAKLEIDLGERVKELECLYGISKLRETRPGSPADFLRGVVDLLPRSWRYPQLACARIKIDQDVYTSRKFRQGPWRMAVDVRDGDTIIGAVEVFYSRDVPARSGEPFLKEEYALLRVIGERVATSLMHMKAEAELKEAHLLLHSQHRVLEETNIALRTVLSRLEEEKQEIRVAVMSNIQKIIMPIVSELELATTGRQRSYVTLLRRSLQEIVSPFLAQLSARNLQLSPGELAICAMIRNGLSTKEIAQIRCIAPGTVRRHRENIRRKMGLHHRGVNLASYLQSSPAETTSHAEVPGIHSDEVLRKT